MPSHRSAPPAVTIAVLALCGMVTSLQFTLAIPILPAMPEILSITSDDASWLVTATLLTSAISTPIVSRMADMYGKRRMLILALAVMAIGSVVAAVGGSFFALIVGRALQGLASSLIPVGISILRDQLPKNRMGSAVALMSATMGIGAALGLPLSGVLFEAFGWESLFWFTAIAGGVFIVLVYLVVPESTLRLPARFDIVGAILLSAILTSLLLVISKGGAWGWDSGAVIGLLILAAVSTALWIPLQLRVNDPVVDLRTASRRPVLLTNIASAFLGFAMFMNMLLTTQQLHSPVETGFGFGLSVAAAGLAMVPPGLAMVVLSPLSGYLLGRFGGRPVLIVGSAIMAVSYVARVFLDASVTEIIIGSTLVAIGTALSFAAMPTLIMASVPITETASANGLNSLIRAIGTSSCSAVVALVLSRLIAPVDGVDFATADAIQLCLWLAAAAALIAAIVGVLIPIEATTADAKPGRSDDTGRETLIHGRVILGDESARSHPAIVTVLNLDGTQVDWTRADHTGRYAAVLPDAGRYLIVANAPGWMPSTQVIDVDNGDTERDVALCEQLALTGRVLRDGSAVADALVVLGRVEGGFVASARSQLDGGYRVPLPPPGYYFVTAVAPDESWAQTLKIQLSVRSATLDFEVSS